MATKTPASKPPRARKPRKLSDEQLMARVDKLCQADDAGGLLDFMALHSLLPHSEMDMRELPIERALKADAPLCFQALAELDLAQGCKGLDRRLWGGATPLTRAACASGVHDDDPNLSSPKCLAWALGADPRNFARTDEDGRSLMRHAAMADGAQALLLLAEHASRGSPALKRKAKSMAQGAVMNACHVNRDPVELFKKLDILAGLGADWLGALDKEGRSAFGVAVAGNKQDVCVAMLDRGADPMSPYVGRIGMLGTEVVKTTCAGAFFTEFALDWRYKPRLAKAMIDKMDDASLESLFGPRMKSWLAWSEPAARRAADPDGLQSQFNEHVMSLAGPKILAAREALALRACASKPSKRKAKASL